MVSTAGDTPSFQRDAPGHIEERAPIKIHVPRPQAPNSHASSAAERSLATRAPRASPACARGHCDERSVGGGVVCHQLPPALQRRRQWSRSRRLQAEHLRRSFSSVVRPPVMRVASQQPTAAISLPPSIERMPTQLRSTGTATEA